MKKLFILCFTLLTFTMAFGQGFESFDNFSEPGNSYANGSFVGQDGSTWTYVQCRGDSEITGSAIMIGRNRDPQSNFYSGTIANGVSVLSFDYKQAFTTNVNLNVLINDVVVGNVTSNGEQEIIKSSGDIQVDVSGDFIIKFINAENGNGQVVVDNLAWTAFNANAVATPSFSPPGGIFNDPVDVEITCNTPEAQIFYTLDGSDPDENSTTYSSAINISEATTLKARAYAWGSGLEPSAIAQANYAFSQLIEVENLSELRDAFTGGSEEFKVTGEVFLSFQQDFRGQKYIQDDDAGILIDDDAGVITSSYTVNDGITGLTGSMSEFGGMLQFVPSVDPGVATSSGNQITPVEISLSEMNSGFEDYESRLVKIPNVSFVKDTVFINGYVYQITDNSKANANFRTTFYNVDYIGTLTPTGAGTMMGILNSRNDGNYITARNQADMVWGLLGEPTNYPTNFAASGGPQSVSISWTDAIGDVIPGGYLVLISDQEDFTGPTDGTPVANDLDLSDGSGAINVLPGEEMCAFTQLMENTTYYSIIFPYTNSGADINYKTDGVPPFASATTQEAPTSDVLFTTFNNSWENWIQYNVIGDQVWGRDNTFGIDGTACAKMSGFSGEAFENEDWLISPAVDLTASNDEMLEFYSAVGYTGDALQVLVSTDYDGSGNPNDFTWDNLTDQAIWPVGDPFFEWTNSGDIDLAAYTEQSIYIAFKFTSTTEGSATWEIDNVRVKDESSGIAENHPQVNLDLYPNPSTGILYFNADKPVTGLEVYTVSGMLVYREANTATQGQIDLSQLSKGIYVVKINADNTYTLSRRIVIQ